MSRLKIALAAALVIGIAVVLYIFSQTPPPAIDGSSQDAAFKSMDDLQEELARRARTRLGEADDFQVIVTQAAFPIGTLIRRGRTIPVSYVACRPGALPPEVATPSLFANYTLTRDVAGAIGLDPTVIRRLASANVDVSRSNAVSLSFRNLQAQMLADSDLGELTQNAGCRAAIASGPVLLVRGYIAGQRTFSLRTTNNSAAAATVENVGNLRISPGVGQNAVMVSDENRVPFLQIISQVALASPADTSLAVSVPNTSGQQGRIYVQQDRADTSGTPRLVVDRLRAASMNVVPTVERIESQRVPPQAQVRFFNDTDRARAQSIVDELRPIYPNVRAVQIGLPAPEGQLEVWAPRSQNPN